MNRYLAVKRGWANVKLVKTHLKIRVFNIEWSLIITQPKMKKQLL
jgi:hypothetical protein